MKHLKNFNENLNNNDDYIKKSDLIEDLEERQRLIESHMEIVKNNPMYEYALGRMYQLLEEVKSNYIEKPR